MENLQKNLDALLPEIEGGSLLLHSCCGPCSSYVLEYLSRYLDITLLYYNPNISPEEEYLHRLSEQKRLLAEKRFPRPVKLLESTYDPARFAEAVKGLEDKPEGGERCELCFRLRLEETAKTAARIGADYFCTTLSVSPHKDAVLLEALCCEMEEAHGIPHLPADFKKRGGYQRSIQLSREHGLYRQEYCGCAFSLRESSEEGRAVE
ncbi:MAG: epoxyqueuosine reductase QueH [Oscillospiraceae bacterium]